MEAIKRTQHNIYEVFYFITDRFPGLFALLITLAIIVGLVS
jgi:hypothetical protein